MYKCIYECRFKYIMNKTKVVFLLLINDDTASPRTYENTIRNPIVKC